MFQPYHHSLVYAPTTYVQSVSIKVNYVVSSLILLVLKISFEDSDRELSGMAEPMAMIMVESQLLSLFLIH